MEIFFYQGSGINVGVKTSKNLKLHWINTVLTVTLSPFPGSDEEKAKLDPAYHLNTTNLETRETLAELYKDYKGDQLLASTMKEPKAKKTDKINAVRKNIKLLKSVT